MSFGAGATSFLRDPAATRRPGSIAARSSISFRSDVAALFGGAGYRCALAARRFDDPHLLMSGWPSPWSAVLRLRGRRLTGTSCLSRVRGNLDIMTAAAIRVVEGSR